MKKLLIGLLVLASVSAFASEVTKTITIDRGDSKKRDVMHERLCDLAVEEEALFQLGAMQDYRPLNACGELAKKVELKKSKPVKIDRYDGTKGWAAQCEIVIKY